MSGPALLGRQTAIAAFPKRINFREWQSHDMQPFMAVTRIVANLLAPDPNALAQFYSECFGLDLQLDMGWIAFLTRSSSQAVELHTASQGGSGTELPVISIGVDNIDEAEATVRASGAEIVYGPVKESWGLRRFYFRDPAGNLVNVVDNWEPLPRLTAVPDWEAEPGRRERVLNLRPAWVPLSQNLFPIALSRTAARRREVRKIALNEWLLSAPGIAHLNVRSQPIAAVPKVRSIRCGESAFLAGLALPRSAP